MAKISHFSFTKFANECARAVGCVNLQVVGLRGGVRRFAEFCILFFLKRKDNLSGD